MRERVALEREMDALGIQEFETAIVDPTTWSVTVGQRIVLDLDTTALRGKVSTVTWTIPGRAVRSYSGDAHSAAVFELGSDLQQPKVIFYWVDAEKGHKVVGDVVTTDGKRVRYLATFNVEAPKLDFFTEKSRLSRLEKAHGEVGVRLGHLDRQKAGVRFDWSVTMPPRQAGFVKNVQTVFGDRTQTLRIQPGSRQTRTLVRRHPRKQELHEQLDGHFGNEAGYTDELWTVKRPAGTSTGKLWATDSPHSSLPKLLTKLVINQRFLHFLMFKPDTPNAIWVPIAKAEWHWKVTATRVGTTFKLKPNQDPKPKITLSTTDFPIYATNVAENQWIELPR